MLVEKSSHCELCYGKDADVATLSVMLKNQDADSRTEVERLRRKIQDRDVQVTQKSHINTSDL